MKKCVLVVEDEPFIRMDTVDIVERAGFDVLEAANADEAIRLLERNPAIAIVLTDVEMPGTMNGIRLAQVVRDRWPPIHLIVVSGRVLPHNDELPANTRFVGKPFRPLDIERVLREIAA